LHKEAKPVSTIVVNSSGALSTALSHAHAGDVIKLAAGTYSSVSIKNFNPNGAITITSQDPSHQAVITGLDVTNSSGLNFNNLEFSFPVGNGTAAPHGIMVRSSHDVHFLNDNIHGVLNNDPTNDVTGIGISQSSNVSVQNSQLQELHSGVTVGSSDHVTISGDYIHDIRVDGIEGAGDDTITISNNLFTDFHHVGTVTSTTTGDHSDAIQFWTTGQTRSTTNLTIANNVIDQGAGRDMQGIFLQDLGGKLPYQNVAVTGNLIVGGNWNGIMVDHAQGLTLANNTVDTLSTQTQTPWIRVTNSTGATLTNNSAEAIGVTNHNTGLVQSNNHIIGAVTDGGLGALSGWMQQHPGNTISLLGLHASDLAAATLGAGSAHAS
jgi:hypothetical protein